MSWRTRSTAAPIAPRVPVCIVGYGRVGGALAVGLERAKWPVSVFPHSGESLRRAAQRGHRLSEHEQLHAAGICILAVPDSVVGVVADNLRADLGPQTAMVHCAGALSLAVLGTQPEQLGRPRGSFHPLCAISSPEDALSGHAVALSASTPELLSVLERMALELELHPLEVPESGRALYHAGAVLAAGGLTALASAATSSLAGAGISEDEALRALLPLMRSALRSVEARGLVGGLTGPIARGDANVIEAHLEALPDELRGLYRLLSLRALELAGPRLPAPIRSALDRLLRS